jgi:hypothetical protein
VKETLLLRRIRGGRRNILKLKKVRYAVSCVAVRLRLQAFHYCKSSWYNKVSYLSLHFTYLLITTTVLLLLLLLVIAAATAELPVIMNFNLGKIPKDFL